MTPSEARKVTPVPAELLALVPAPTDKNVTIRPHTPDVEGETMPLIVNKTKRTAWQTKKLAAKLKGYSMSETLSNDSAFILNHIAYKLDDPQAEQIRSPRRLVYDGHGDCDCYAVFLGTLLLNQGIKFRFRIAQYANSGGDWTHIYVVVPKDQSFKGSLTSRSQYYVLDPVTNSHNYEVPFLKKLDITMSLQYLDGISRQSERTIGRLGACASQSESIQQSSSTQILDLRRFVDTHTVIDKGFVPTQQLLEANFWPYEQLVDTQTNAGYFHVSSPSGMIKVAPVLTQAEAQQLKDIMEQRVSVPKEAFTSEPAPAPQSTAWLSMLLTSIGIIASLKGGGGAVGGLSGPPKKHIKRAVSRRSIPTVKI